jgi:hypothetical protein
MYNPLYSTLQPLCSTCFCYKKKRDVLRWVHTCDVTAYRNTVLWQRGRDSCPRNLSKVGYAVTLRACSVCCQYLAVASKEWYGYGRSRCGRATSRCTSTPGATTWDRRLYFPSEGRRAEHFFALKIQWLRPAQFQLIQDTSRQPLGWILSDTVNTVKCSWWWPKTTPKTCRADLG